MEQREKINIETFKIITKAIAKSDSLETMANHLCQLLVAALEIKGCTLFVLNLDAAELEILASFGLSHRYLSKGPIRADKSIGCTLKGDPVIISDVTRDQSLQYPREAKEEGIRSILSFPIMFLGDAIGVLRLYHLETWDVPKKDVDSLLLLAENIGLALRYTTLLNTVQAFRKMIDDLPIPVGPVES